MRSVMKLSSCNKKWRKQCLSLLLIMAMTVPTVLAQLTVPTFASDYAGLQTNEPVLAKTSESTTPAALSVPITIRVEANDVSLVPSQKIDVNNLDLIPYGGTNPDSPRIIQGLIKALESQGLDCKDKAVLDASGCANVKSICGLEQAGSRGWMFYVNQAFSSTGVYDTKLKPEDRIVFFYVEDWSSYWFTWFEKEQEVVHIGDDLSVTLRGSSYDMYSNKTVESPIKGASILLNDQVIQANGQVAVTDDKGQLKVHFDRPGKYILSAERKAADGHRDLVRPYCEVTVLDEGVVDKTKLNQLLQVSEKTLSDADSQAYAPESIESLRSAIAAAKLIYLSVESKSVAVTKAENDLKGALDTFKLSQRFDKSVLKLSLASAESKYNLAETGTTVGQYPAASKEMFGKAIDLAKRMLNDTTLDQKAVDAVVAELNSAMVTFTQSVVKPQLTDTIAVSVGYLKSNTKKVDLIGQVALRGVGEDLNSPTWSDKVLKIVSTDLKPPYNYPGATAMQCYALMAQGQDPTDFDGRNILKELATMQQTDGGFAKAGKTATFSDQQQVMLALDAGKTQYDTSKAITYLLKYQKTDGGFASYGEEGALDSTGIALQVLSNHRDAVGVNESIVKAINFIKSTQDSSGELVEKSGTNNPTAMAKAILGVSASGEKILSGSWVKNGNTVVDALLRYQNSDGSYFTDKTKKVANSSATSYCLIALSDLHKNQSTFMNLGQAVVKPTQKTLNWYQSVKLGKLDDWWDLVAVRGAGIDFKNKEQAHLWTLKAFESDGIQVSKATITDYAGTIIGMMAKGEDPSKAWGNKRNLIQELKSRQAQGVFGDTLNSHVWAMIALDCAKATYDQELATQYLAKHQLADGGFAFWGTQSDADSTAMAMLALSHHRVSNGVDEALNKSIVWLKNQQLETGGFSSYGTENSNTIATVISGLVAIGQDPTDLSWTKKGKNLSNALKPFRLDDGSYTYSLKEPQSNGLATKQSLIALDDLQNGKSVFDIISNQKIFEPGNPDALKVLQAEALNCIKNSKKGNLPGQYPEFAVHQLQEMVDRVGGVITDASTSQGVIDQLKDELQQAIKTFKKSGVPITEAKKVHIRVEGIQRTLFSGDVTVKASAESVQTALDALEQGLALKSVPFVAKDSSYEAYISQIADDQAGKFGGYEGWCYAVNNVSASVGVSQYKIKDGDEILFYYGGMDTYLPTVDLLEGRQKIGKTWQVRINAIYDEWNADYTVKTSKTKPISEAEVTFGNRVYKTDSMGLATLDSGTTTGTSYFSVSKNKVGSYPEIVRRDNLAVVFTAPESQKIGLGSKTEIKNEAVSLVVPKGTASSKLSFTSKKESGMTLVTAPFIEVRTEASVGGQTETSVMIPQETQIVGPANWNGEMMLPRALSASDLPSITGVSKALEVGLPGQTLTFDKPVRLLLTDQANKKVGFIGLDGALNEITQTLAADSYEEASKIQANGAAKMNVGKDLVIWTRHFTKFVAYDAGGTGTGGSGGTGGTGTGGSGGTGGTGTGGVTPPTNQDFKVSVTILGKQKESLYSGTVTLTDQDLYKKTAMGALAKSGITYELSSNHSNFVTSIGGQANKGLNGWMYKVNGTVPSVLASDCPVSNGSSVFWWYSTGDDSMTNGTGGNVATGSVTVPTPLVPGGAVSTSGKLIISKSDVKTTGDQLLYEALNQSKGVKAVVSVNTLKNGGAELSLQHIKALASAKMNLAYQWRHLNLNFSSSVLDKLASSRAITDSFGLTFTEVNQAEGKVMSEAKDVFGSKLEPVGLPVTELAAQLNVKNGKGDTVQEKVSTLSIPVVVEMDLSSLQINERLASQLTGVRYLKLDNGSYQAVKLGGTYDADSKTFRFLTERFGHYGIAKAENITQIQLKIDDKAYLLNGKAMSFDQFPRIYDGRTFVPLAAITKALGGKVVWNDQSRTVHLTVDGQTMTYNLKSTASSQGTGAMIFKGRTFVPIGEVSKSLGAYVLWVPETQSVLVVK